VSANLGQVFLEDVLVMLLEANEFGKPRHEETMHRVLFTDKQLCQRPESILQQTDDK
jgi:hypothetical protein